ncbi:hypothetical protein Y032_0272g952 [Ancylostoma ceylanicum]|uniref:SCP domain-containing protein n=1 Tax=Ancylostoma ceylanicum TaxID=53326 RepID=A0A016S9D4_9BILA|nr:hypothetical protein Y032_0272g952 [Ancylostoma ceylanicum]
MLPFGCKNSLISDDWREAVLKYHNDQRRKVSRGQQTDKDGAALKTAGEMYQLTWDCNLEAIAHTELVKCAGVSKITIGQTEHDFNEGVISTKPKKCNLEDDTKTLLKSWWNEVRQETFPTDMKYTEKFRHFAPDMLLSPTCGTRWSPAFKSSHVRWRTTKRRASDAPTQHAVAKLRWSALILESNQKEQVEPDPM